MSSEKDIFFSLVIPTFERPNDLRKCLHSVSKENQNNAPPYEIIVTDDSQSNKCKNVVVGEFPDIKWTRGKQKGPAGNRNAGESVARGLWIVFLDDDCVAQPNFLRAYANAIEQHPNVKLFEGKIFPDRPRKTWAEGCSANENGGLYWTSNLCVRKTLFESLSGFDERFEVAYEDVDFAYRAKVAGTNLLFVKEAQVCHPWRSVRKGGKNWKVKNYESADFIRFLKKHNPEEPEFSIRGYLRNLFRMISVDMLTCVCVYRMRGIDILLFQMLVTIKGMFDILIHKKK